MEIFQKHESSFDLQDQTILLYGEPKIGKTWFFSQRPKTYFLATEVGHKHINWDGVNVFNFSEVLEFIRNLQDNQEKFKEKYDLICIDTIDNFCEYAFHHVCNTNNVEHVSDLQWGKGWDKAARSIGTTVKMITSMGIAVGFISHEFTKEHLFKGRTVSKILPNLGTTARKIVMPMVDIIAHMHMDSHTVSGKRQYRRAIICHPHPDRESGDRNGIFTEKVICEPKENCYPSFVEAWKKGTEK